MSRRKHLESLGALTLGLIAGLLVAWPALGNSAILGARNNDLDGALWYRWYLLDALRSGHMPDFTRAVAFPLGTDMLVRDGCNLVDTLLSLPLVVALGPFAAHDAWAVLLVAANWLAFDYASRTWIGEEPEHFWPRQLGAVLFALSPIALEELGNGRVTQAFLVWQALLLRECWQLDRSRFAWLRGGLWLALTGLTYWYAAIWCGAVAALVALVRDRKRAAGMMTTALVLVAPVLALYAARAGGGPNLGLVQRHMFVLWSDGGTALVGPGGDVGLDPVGMGRLLGPEAPLGLLALAWLAWRERGAWIALAIGGLLALLFALGPEPLQLGSSPLYAAFLALGPLAERLWFPLRALVVFAAATAMALGTLSAARPKVAALCLVIWPLALAALGVLPLARWEPPRSPVLSWLAAEPPGAVVALPNSAESTWRAAQIQYEKPVQLSLGGENPALEVPGWHAWADGRVGMVALGDALLGEAPRTPPAAEDWAALRADGFGYVLLDRQKLEMMRGEAGAKIVISRFKKVLGKPVEADSHYLAWRLPDPP